VLANQNAKLTGPDQGFLNLVPRVCLCAGYVVAWLWGNRCRDHQCCRHINACFFARIMRGHTRRENYQCLSDLECEIKQYKSKDIIILIVWTSNGTLGIYLQNGMVFMNDFLSIYSMSILTYLYVETTAYKFRIYFIILTMKELAKWNHRTRCRCFVNLNLNLLIKYRLRNHKGWNTSTIYRVGWLEKYCIFTKTYLL
jgi:hypothetical protein